MDFLEISSLLENHTTAKLIRATNASLIISFLFKAFKTTNQNLKADTIIRQLISLNGGDRLKQIEREIQIKESSKNQKSKKHDKYLSLTTFLDLENAQNEQVFFKNRVLAEENLKELSQKSENLLSIFTEQTIKYSALQSKIQSEKKELESLKTRENQIPLAFLELREILSKELNINTSTRI